jgi:hypothetical protein
MWALAMSDRFDTEPIEDPVRRQQRVLPLSEMHELIKKPAMSWVSQHGFSICFEPPCMRAPLALTFRVEGVTDHSGHDL